MKLALQYVNDSEGKTQAVQLSVADWNKVLHALRKYEQSLQLKGQLKTALAEVKKTAHAKRKPQNLEAFLDAL